MGSFCLIRSSTCFGVLYTKFMTHFLAKMEVKSFLFVAALFCFSFFYNLSVVNAAGCGSIIAPQNWSNTSPDFENTQTTAIEDCTNPFNVTVDPPSPYTLILEGQTISASNTQTVLVEGDAVTDYRFTGHPHQSDVIFSVFRHVGGDLEYVSMQSPDITDAGYLAFAETYFANPVIRAFYIEIFNSDDKSSYFDEYDPAIDDYVDKVDEEGRDVSGRFYNFLYAAETAHYNQKPALPLGTYTFVWSEYTLVLTQKSLWERFIDTVIPTAYAYDYIPPNIYAQTVTLAKTPPAPTGASSVLFLPGIQASRLYKTGLFGLEDELWIPGWNQDVRQLGMTVEGESVEEVYTRDILDQVIGVGTVYGSFASKMDDLVEDDLIADWEAYAYDWRYSVDDVVKDGTRYEDEVKNVINILEDLATESFSNKVTIIAHSNGGLLAKALLTELQLQNKAHLVDKLVLLASPQLGTPKAVGSLLHGLDQEAAGGVVIDAAVARSVMKNMPGAYGLLPTEEYLSATGKPIVYFSEQLSTKQFRDVYGNDIDNINELSQFVIGNTDNRNNAESVYDAEKLNSGLYDKAQTLHKDVLQTWRAPTTTKVFEVVGVGLSTVSGFEYKEFKEVKCRTEYFTETCTESLYYKPILIPSLYGDETVMAQSAKGYRGDKETYFFDLEKQGKIFNYRHVNFTEAPAIQSLVTKVIKNEEIKDIPFISTEAVIPDLELGLLSVNSPANIRVSNNNGEVTEISFEDGDFVSKRTDIPNSSIYYFGSTTYIVLPINDVYDLNITGTGKGGVTVALDIVDEDKLVNTYTVWLSDTNAGMQVSAKLDDSVLSALLVDKEGDGVDDYTVDVTTGVKQPITDASAVKSPVAKQTGTKVNRDSLPKGKVAGISTSTTDVVLQEYYQRLHILLQKLSLILKEYEKSKNI